MKRYLPHIAFTLFVLQLLLMMGSWLLSAAFPVDGIHSLLSSEGLRWFLGHYATLIGSPWMAWLLLLSIAYGCLRHSGLLRPGKSYRERSALYITILLAALLIAVVLLLTIIPHAVLLSATGELWPSPFSHSLVPLIAFSILLLGICYGMVSGTLENLTAIYNAMLDGIRRAAPFFIFYILIAQIYESLKYIFL